MYQEVFKLIETFTDTNTKTEFVNIEKGFYCNALDLFTSDPHINICCIPVLIRCPKKIASGWFKGNDLTYVYYDGEWCNY